MARMLVIGALVLLVAGMFPPPATARGLPSSEEESIRSGSVCPEPKPNPVCYWSGPECTDERPCPYGVCCTDKCGQYCYYNGH